MKRNLSLKKIVLSCIAIVLIAAPTMSFADTVTPTEKIDAYRTKLTEVIGNYAPELQSTFDGLWEEHDALHGSLKAERERIFSENAAEGKSFMESIKASLLSKELTREEAKVQIEAYRAGLKAERESTQAEIDALKASYDVPEGTVKALNEALKSAVEADDSEAVVAALTEIINSLTQHLTFDQAKLDLLMTK